MMTRYTLDAFNMSIKYLWQPRKNQTIYYRRRIPVSLEHHYTQLKSPFITKSTGTSTKNDAISEILKINEEIKKEWAILKEKDKRGSNSNQILKDAQAHLQDYSITSLGDGNEVSKGELYDDLKSQIPYETTKHLYDLAMSNDPYHNDLLKQAIKDNVEPYKQRALELIQDGLVLKASEYIPVYADLKGLDINSKQIKDCIRDVEKLVVFLGDRPPSDYSKIEINAFIKARLEIGVKTGTIRRNFNSINAVFNLVNSEYEIDFIHRFNSPNIPHFGDDKKEKVDYSSDQLLRIRSAVKGSINTTDQIIGLLVDTGMRSGEAVGLASKDIVLNDEHPYIALHKNTFRRLKTNNSQRIIPLVGASLETATNLKLDGQWVFEKYLDKSKSLFKTTSANNTINKRIRKILNNPLAPSSHSFRHTMVTRLRDAECPEYIRKEIGGWASSLSEKYGSPTDVEIKAKYINSSIDGYSRTESSEF